MSNRNSLNLGSRRSLPIPSSPLIASQIEKLLPGSEINVANRSAALNSREFNLMNDMIGLIGRATGNDTSTPSGVLNVINGILSRKYVRLPNHMGENLDIGRFNQVRDLLNRWVSTSGPNVDRIDYVSPKLLPDVAPGIDESRLHSGTVNKIPGNPDIDDTADITQFIPNQSVLSRYDWIYDDPYNNKNMIQFVDSNYLVQQLNDIYGLGIGYDTYRGFTIGQNSQWAIQMYPYKKYQSGKGPVTNFPDSRYCLVKDLPYYTLPASGALSAFTNGSYDPNFESSSVGFDKGIQFSFSKYLPAMSWSLNFGSWDTLEFDLFNGGTMTVPLGFKYNMTLTVEIVDDQYYSLDKYFRSYINTIYDQNTRAIAPYWASAFWIPIVLFREGYAVNYRFNLIGIPTNFGTALQSGEPGSEARVSLEFSVLGIQIYNNGDGQVFPGPVGADNQTNLKELTWNDITLRAN